MSLEQQAIAIGQVLLTVILVLPIGWQRERVGKSAGLRTHILSGVGACVFTLLSIYAFPGWDTTRIASNVVTGIGFLGAGVIVHQNGNAHDLTTAASIWATASIGMTVASGAWLFAIGATVIMWSVLTILHPLSRAINPQAERAHALPVQSDEWEESQSIQRVSRKS